MMGVATRAWGTGNLADGIGGAARMFDRAAGSSWAQSKGNGSGGTGGGSKCGTRAGNGPVSTGSIRVRAAVVGMGREQTGGFCSAEDLGATQGTGPGNRGGLTAANGGMGSGWTGSVGSSGAQGRSGGSGGTGGDTGTEGANGDGHRSARGFGRAWGTGNGIWVAGKGWAWGTSFGSGGIGGVGRWGEQAGNSSCGMAASSNGAWA